MITVKKIPFQGRYLNSGKFPPLPSAMVIALLEWIKSGRKEIAFKNGYVPMPLTTLIARRLLVQRKIYINGQRRLQWQLTKQGIKILKALGIRIKSS